MRFAERIHSVRMLIFSGEYDCCFPDRSESFGFRSPDIFLRADEKALRRRLVDRKQASGNTLEKAEDFVDFSDMRNVRHCLEKSKQADMTLRILEDGSIRK